MAGKQVAKVEGGDLAEREKAGRAFIAKIDKAVERLKQGGVILVRTQADADQLASVINKMIPEAEKWVESWFGIPRKKAWDSYKEALRREQVFAKPLEQRKKAFRTLLANWLQAEQRRREREAAERQKEIDEKFGDGAAVVTQAENASVEGLFARSGGKAAKVVDPIKLVKLIAAGKAPLDLIAWNESALRECARNKWDATEKDENGRGHIFDGAVEIWDQAGLQRARQ